LISLFWVVLGTELRVSHLLSKRSTTWPVSLVLLLLGFFFFQIKSHTFAWASLRLWLSYLYPSSSQDYRYVPPCPACFWGRVSLFAGDCLKQQSSCLCFLSSWAYRCVPSHHSLSFVLIFRLNFIHFCCNLYYLFHFTFWDFCLLLFS
jgi:hypothetical protein